MPTRTKQILTTIVALVGAATATVLSFMFINAPTAPQDSSALVQGRRESGYEFVGYLISNKLKVCAATLLDADTVLTAAHCVNKAAGDNFNFGTGNFAPDSEI